MIFEFPPVPASNIIPQSADGNPAAVTSHDLNITENNFSVNENHFAYRLNKLIFPQKKSFFDLSLFSIYPIGYSVNMPVWIYDKIFIKTVRQILKNSRTTRRFL